MGVGTIAVPGAWRRLSKHRLFYAVRSFAVFIALWWAVAAWIGNPIQIPTPGRVAAALYNLAEVGEIGRAHV